MIDLEKMALPAALEIGTLMLYLVQNNMISISD